MRLFRYTLRYEVNAAGAGTRATVAAGPMHESRFRFLGNASGQGDVRYEVPVRVTMNDVRLTGDFGGGLGTLIAITRVDAVLRCHQNYTIGVQTSEQRDRFASSELLQSKAPGFGGATTMRPAALCCLPVGAVDAALADDELHIECGLTAAGWGLGVLVPAVIAAVGSAAVMAILWPILLAVAPALVGALTISIVIAALVGAGVGLLAAVLIQELLVKPLVRSTIVDALRAPTVAASLQEGGILRYAGEGLAEALTVQLIRQAQQDGHAVPDPIGGGLDRVRAPFVETIVVSEGACQALVRV